MAVAERGRGRPSETERQDMDERVIEAAFAIFRSEGFEGARMERVAADAGITKVSLYRRFSGKGDLLAEVIRRQSERFHDDIPPPEPLVDPVGAIKTLMWTYRQRIGADRLLTLQRLALTALREDPVRRSVADAHARYVAPVDFLVDAAKERGALPALPTAELREILFDLLVNDAAALPLHGYPAADDQYRIFLQRWDVLEKGLLGTQPTPGSPEVPDPRYPIS